MKIALNVEFEFSGCDYHPPPPPGFQEAKDLLQRWGHMPETAYEVWAFRDLLLRCSEELARNWPSLLTSIRQDVEDRLGYRNGVSPHADHTTLTEIAAG